MAALSLKVEVASVRCCAQPRRPTMSVERVKRKGGVAWRVRWRDNSGGEHSRTLGRKRDAEAFDAEVKRRKRTGDLDSITSGKQTLAEFAEEWWRLYAEPNLARSTLEVYA